MQHLIDVIKMALRGLSTHKSRSTLTILGIVIGISSIMLIMSIGSSVESFVLDEVSNLGSNYVQLNPGKQPTGPQDASSVLMTDSLKDRELNALKDKNNVPDLQDITPAFPVPGDVSYGGDVYHKITVFGWTADWLDKLFGVEPAEGDFFTQDDIDSRANVAVIGAGVKEEIFPNTDDVLGQKIKVKNIPFRIVGVLEDAKTSPFMDINKIIVIPWSTAQHTVLGIDYYQELHMRATSEEAVPAMVSDIKSTLRSMHDITNPDDDDFFITTQDSIMSSISTITTMLTVLLTSVAAISLVVGGVGIMNIMLVSVTERTREIGLRKALGATNRSILTQFLIEAVVLTVLGGVIGILLGVGLSYLASVAVTAFTGYQFPFSLPVSGALLGLGVSGAIGLVFGIFPARQAALKSPMEALRYE